MKRKITLLKKHLIVVFLLTIFVFQGGAQLCVPPLISLQPLGASACPGNTALFSVISLGTNLNYQWQVNTGSGFTNCTNGSTFSGATSANLNVTASASLSASQYRCLVSNTCGSALTNVCLLNLNSLPTVICTPQISTICSGGSITLSASGATSYLWSTGSTAQSIVVSPGATTSYACTGTNLLGCSNTTSATVTVVAAPNVNINASANSICAGASVTLTASGATSFLWNTGSIASSIVVSPGSTTTYACTGTNANGCSVTTTKVITVNSLPSVNINASANSICAGASVTLTASGATNFLWGTGSTASSIVVSPGSTTTYTCTGTNANGCSASTTKVITVNSLPSVNINASANAICAGASVTLTASGATNFLWGTGSTSSSIVVSPGSTTTYACTGTNANGCSASTTKVITVNSLPSVNINASANSICAGASVTLTASGATNFLWGTGSTAASIVVSPNSTTTYACTGTNANGCSASTTKVITVNSLPSVNITASANSICAGASVTLTASGATSFLWGTGSTAASIVVSPGSTTTYACTGTNANGCSATTTKVITVNSLPSVNVNASANSICAGASVTLTASGATNFLWNTGSTASSIVVSPNSTTTYACTGTNANGCSASTTKVITVNSLPSVNINASANSICAGASVTLTASGATNFIWGTGSTASSIVVSPGSTTTYAVTGTNANGCSQTANVTIAVNALPSVNVNASANSICAGASVTLTASGAASFLWNTGSTASSIVVSPNSTTTYAVAGTNTNGCFNSANAIINVNALPSININASASSICAGGSATLTASGATNFLWNTGSTASSIVISPNSTTTYACTGTNANGCSQTTNVTIAVNALPNVNINASANSICAGASATLTANGATNFLWNTASTVSSIVVSPNLTTTYACIGTDANGCSQTTNFTIGVNALPSVNINASNASICVGDQVTLSASGALNFQWSNNSTSSSIMVSPAVTTTYFVTGTDVNGCTNSASSTIVVNAAPIVNINASAASICAGDSVTLTASGASGFLWNNSSTSSCITVSPVSTTTYVVTGTNGNCSNSTSAVVVVNALPNVNINASAASICAGTSATLTASGAATFLWNNSSTASNIVVNPTANTTYYVTGVDINGCSANAMIVVNVDAMPIINIVAKPASICAGATTTLTANADVATGFLWSNGCGFASAVVSPSVTTTYAVIVSNGACSGTSNAVITVNPLPVVTCVATPSVIGLLGTSLVSASGAVSYSWSTGGLTSLINVSPLVTTTYFVTGVSAEGCSNTASATVIVNLLGGGLFKSSDEPVTNIDNELMLENNDIHLYPNPNNGTFIVNGTLIGSRIDVYDLLGKKVMSKTAENELTEIKLNDTVNNGIYFVKICFENKTLTLSKIIIQK